MKQKENASKSIKKTEIGRPSKYNPDYCGQLIAHMSQGFSYHSFAGVIGVCYDTLHEWEKHHAAFSDAKKIATAISLHWWEHQGILGLWFQKEGMQFNTPLWIFNMKNRHKWRDKQPDEMQSSTPIVLAYDPFKKKV